MDYEKELIELIRGLMLMAWVTNPMSTEKADEMIRKELDDIIMLVKNMESQNDILLKV